MLDGSNNKKETPKIAEILYKFVVFLWQSLRTYYIHLIIILVLIAADLLTKTAINANIKLGESITIIPDFLYFTNVHNTGASFSLMEGQRTLFLIITPLALIFFFYLLFTSKGQHRFYSVTIIMVIAGAFGNYIDRIAYAYVRDFIEIVYFGYDLPLLGTSFAIFNIADMLLVIGMILFAVYFIFFYKTKEKRGLMPDAGSAAAPSALPGDGAADADACADAAEEKEPDGGND